MSFKKLKVSHDTIKGKGKDEIGKFKIHGHINAAGAIHFKKEYHGAHTVDYNGHWGANGEITGQWSVGGATGSFNLSQNWDSSSDSSSDSD